MDNWQRRDVLKCGAALGAGSLALTTTTRVGAAPGEQQWAFETGSSVDSSPTVVDGTVFVGSSDNNLYALDAGVSWPSGGSRVMLGTLGHHRNRSLVNPQMPTPKPTESPTKTLQTQQDQNERLSGQKASKDDTGGVHVLNRFTDSSGSLGLGISIPGVLGRGDYLAHKRHSDTHGFKR
jgi:hypothetical protein